MHKFKPSIKRLSYLNAFSKKRKDFKRGNLTLILDQELDSICDNTRKDEEDDDDDDACDNNEHRESFKQFNEQNVYEELPRLDTLKLSSNNSYSNGVRDVLTTSNYNDDYFHKNIQQNKFNHTGNNVNDRKVTTVKIDRHRSDVQQSDFVYHPNNNPFKIHSKYTNDLKNNSISYHPTNAEHTPTGSTETLIDSTRKLTSTASINYLDEQNTNKLPSTGYVKTTVQCTNSYPNQIIDTNKTSWKTVSIDQSTKYNAQDMNINNSNNNINNSINNEYKVNPRNPRIIYISKSNPVSNENPTKLSTNQNKIVSASQFTHSSTVVDGGGYSPYGYESDQTNMNQFKHTNQTVRKTNIVTIEYENINNDNNNNNQSINKP
ncbi:unnamed protein product [Schistosoma turkestanicum]|nr:unnamed protein product [Schistosoma turkestanicum]